MNLGSDVLSLKGIVEKFFCGDLLLTEELSFLREL